jgi:3-deoxy-D-arabino-heptulosonate 7-phosphate (DAHP) synthase
MTWQGTETSIVSEASRIGRRSFFDLSDFSILDVNAVPYVPRASSIPVLADEASYVFVAPMAAGPRSDRRG